MPDYDLDNHRNYVPPLNFYEKHKRSPFIRTMLTPAFQVSVGEYDGQPFYYISDNLSRILTKDDISKIWTAIKPFYDLFTDEEVEQINQLRQETSKPSVWPVKPDPSPPSSLSAGYIYLVQSGPHYKIGITTDVDRRVKQLGTMPPFGLETVHTIYSEDMYDLERTLHERFGDKREEGEWFLLDDKDVEYIKGL